MTQECRPKAYTRFSRVTRGKPGSRESEPWRLICREVISNVRNDVYDKVGDCQEYQA
jgi:hypothetical protein